jgi:hypothetical protein
MRFQCGKFLGNVPTGNKGSVPIGIEIEPINYAITIIYFAAYRKYGILITILHTYWEKKWIKITLSRLAYL